MNTNGDGICPLCKESFPRGELHAHVVTEQREIVQYALKMIQAQHPEWAEGDGACQRCWEFYDGLGRLVSIYESSAPATRADAPPQRLVDQKGEDEHGADRKIEAVIQLG